MPRPAEQIVHDVDDLRAQGRYEILSPSECVDRIRERGSGYTPCLHPLAGGIPLDRAWRSLELYVEKVLHVLEPDVPEQPAV